MRTFEAIHATNPFAHLLTDDAPFPLKRDIFAWTHRMEALEAAQAALAWADESFAQGHEALRERQEHARRLKDWQRVSRIEWLLQKALVFHREHLAADVRRAEAHLREIEMTLERIVIPEGML